MRRKVYKRIGVGTAYEITSKSQAFMTLGPTRAGLADRLKDRISGIWMKLKRAASIFI